MNVIVTIALTVLGYLLMVLLAVAVLCRTHVRQLWSSLRSRGEVADTGDYYDVDIVPGMQAARETLRGALAEVCPCTADGIDELVGDIYDGLGLPCIEGFTELETAVLRANYLPMSDDERFRLDMALLAIANAEEGAEQ